MHNKPSSAVRYMLLICHRSST